jgi:hypothetical protein
VPASDVAELVGDHALHHVGVVGRSDQPGMDVDDLAAGDEGVDRRIVDHGDLDIVGAEAGGLDQRTRHVAQQLLGLGVAQDRLRHRRPRRQGEAQHQQQKQPGDIVPPATGSESFSHGAHVIPRA